MSLADLHSSEETSHCLFAMNLLDHVTSCMTDEARPPYYDYKCAVGLVAATAVSRSCLCYELHDMIGRSQRT